jgi:hypothetical protein
VSTNGPRNGGGDDADDDDADDADDDACDDADDDDEVDDKAAEELKVAGLVGSREGVVKLFELSNASTEGLGRFRELGGAEEDVWRRCGL